MPDLGMFNLQDRPVGVLRGVDEFLDGKPEDPRLIRLALAGS